MNNLKERTSSYSCTNWLGTCRSLITVAKSFDVAVTAPATAMTLAIIDRGSITGFRWNGQVFGFEAGRRQQLHEGVDIWHNHQID